MQHNSDGIPFLVRLFLRLTMISQKNSHRRL